MLQNAFDDMNTSIGNFFYYTSNAAENMSTSYIVICHLSNFCKIFILRRKPARGPFYQYRLILNPEWISTYIHHKVCDGITYPFPNFNSCSIEVWEWMLFHPTLYWTFHYLSMLGLKLTHLPSATYMHQWTGFVLVQAMACRLFSTKPLPEPMWAHCQLDFWEQIQRNLNRNYINFIY